MSVLYQTTSAPPLLPSYSALLPPAPKRLTRLSRQCISLHTVIGFLFLSACLLVLRHPDPPSKPAYQRIDGGKQQAHLFRGDVMRYVPIKPQSAEVRLDAAQELAAISSFIASAPRNIIPPTVDPTLPVDPQLILDFNSRSSRAAFEVQAMVEDVWLRNPVFLYTSRSRASREVINALALINLSPAPTVVDVDLRDDAQVLQGTLLRLTGFNALPILLVGGRPVGPAAKVKEMAESGELEILIKQAGAVVNDPEVKGKKHLR